MVRKYTLYTLIGVAVFSLGFAHYEVQAILTQVTPIVQSTVGMVRELNESAKKLQTDHEALHKQVEELTTQLDTMNKRLAVAEGRSTVAITFFQYLIKNSKDAKKALDKLIEDQKQAQVAQQKKSQSSEVEEKK